MKLLQQWDLNTGTMVRNFRSHGSQLTAIAVRPIANFHPWEGPPIDPALINAHPPRPGEVPPPGPMDVQPPIDPMDIKPPIEQANTMPLPPVPQQQPVAPAAPPPAPTQDEDAKSDASFDPLFDDEPDADGEADQDASNPPRTQTGSAPDALGIAYPSKLRGSLQQQRSVSAAIAPKNAPPVLDPLSYSTYSSDVIMVASIDGQVVLWDKRVNSPGRGVGRLWMSDKTPPWCVSVCECRFVQRVQTLTGPLGMLVCRWGTDVCRPKERDNRRI